MSLSEYYQSVLTKVSFNSDLFEHELRKALSQILPAERAIFMSWLLSFVYNKPELKKAVIKVRKP